MDASIASEHDPSIPLKLLALSAGGIAAAAVVVAAAVLVLRWGSGAIHPGTSGGSMAVAGSTLILVAAAAVGLRPLRRFSPGRATIDEAAGRPSGERQLAGRQLAAPAIPPWPESRLVQRIERYERRNADGSVVESAVGRVVVRFPEGSRSAVAHVGFCPPFAMTPRVSVSNECDGLEVDLAAAEVLPWGVRIDCRLEEPAEELLEVEVELVAEPADGN